MPLRQRGWRGIVHASEREPLIEKAEDDGLDHALPEGARELAARQGQERHACAAAYPTARIAPARWTVSASVKQSHSPRATATPASRAKLLPVAARRGPSTRSTRAADRAERHLRGWPASGRSSTSSTANRVEDRLGFQVQDSRRAPRAPLPRRGKHQALHAARSLERGRRAWHGETCAPSHRRGRSGHGRLLPRLLQRGIRPRWRADPRRRRARARLPPRLPHGGGAARRSRTPTDGICRGRTVGYTRRRTSGPEPNAHVAVTSTRRAFEPFFWSACAPSRQLRRKPPV